MKLFRQIIVLTLALLLLVSSTGLSVGMHMCGGEIQDLSFFGRAESCGMEQKQDVLPPCHQPKKKQVESKGCCENHQLVVQRLDAGADTKIAIHKTPDVKFLAAFKAVVLQLFAPETATTPAYALYTSPPLARDIPVLVQAFLI
ncbi:hypothetical protein I2I11_16630 [Pontibacter sp. 172403-2]|uniref:HYC_CC_PP family protein n=1 Tax=Pontibacter rufus TaxID=2791028 RepID=UPI0018B0015F|nr:hypothetical protein [Pontibacter sp. 172403-2]MBF9254931.1 hypothetical protein [Pontibacter sp. 172403-2]